MRYLDSEYKLGQVNPAMYKAEAQKFAKSQIAHALQGALRTSVTDYPELADHILMYGDQLQDAYDDGGGFYVVAVAAGLMALRRVSPYHKVRRIQQEDWEAVVAREAELRGRPAVKTLEAMGGIGLLEVREVNQGYVDGYQEVFDTPNLSRALGFSGLGALHAHDLMHFASVGE